ncbi:hypothetical protein [Arthrobacter sp. R-11]
MSPTSTVAASLTAADPDSLRRADAVIQSIKLPSQGGGPGLCRRR